jgi:ribosomal protein L22
LTSILLHNYYYRYSQQRKNVKQEIENGNYVQAKNQLDNVITEHQSKFPNAETRKDFNYGEKLILTQAKNHIQEALIDENNPDLYLVDPITNVVTLGKHSDQVKKILSHTPKQSYNE